MKKNRNIVIALIVLIMYGGLIIARNNQEIFLRANQQYESAHYQEALNFYKSIEKKGNCVWYNMGNCAYQLHDYSWALVYWLRAIAGSSAVEYKGLMRNIDLVEGVAGKVQERYFWSDMFLFLYRLFHSWSLLFLQLLGIICWYMLFFLRKKRFKKTVYNFCLFLVICILMVSSVGMAVKCAHDYYQQGVVCCDKQDLLVGPHADYCVLAQLSKAERVTVYKKIPGWYKVKAGKFVGWVSSDSLEVV